MTYTTLSYYTSAPTPLIGGHILYRTATPMLKAGTIKALKLTREAGVILASLCLTVLTVLSLALLLLGVGGITLFALTLRSELRPIQLNGPEPKPTLALPSAEMRGTIVHGCHLPLNPPQQDTCEATKPTSSVTATPLVKFYPEVAFHMANTPSTKTKTAQKFTALGELARVSPLMGAVLRS